MTVQLGVNAPHVVHETIDGETIVIHLGTGTYYSLDGVGALAWQLLVEGVPSEELPARMSWRYDAEAELVQRSVARFVEELLAEDLLVAGAPPSAPANSEGVESAVASGVAFVEPVLHKYTDMQEFMLVDPIHDVEADVGWPHVKAG